MTLAFSQIMDGKATYFVEKIWCGIKDLPVTEHLANYLHSDYSEKINILDLNPKLHTIRVDKTNRWHVGNNIHFVINNRTKTRLQFAPVLTVKYIQAIEIDYCLKDQKYPIVVIDGAHFYNCLLGIDHGMEKLAIADGFDSVIDFFDYFKDNFIGKIIHWTDLTY